MLKFLREATKFQLIIWSVMVTGVVLSLFTPDIFIFKRGESFAMQLMLAYLAVGFWFLIGKDNRTMFVSFGCCAALCLQLRTRTPFYEATNPQANKFSVATFNVANSDEGYEQTLRAIFNTQADVVMLQEITPDWDSIVRAALHASYPFSYQLVRIDLYGQAVYSRLPILQTDTFHFQDIPNLSLRLGVDTARNQVAHLFNTHTNPPVGYVSMKNIDRHLQLVAQRVNQAPRPVIAMGDLNSVPWSTEVLAFRQRTGLFDSRRDNRPLGPPPFDHIFYSEGLTCTGFKEITGQFTPHLGIMAYFEFTELADDNTDPAQPTK